MNHLVILELPVHPVSMSSALQFIDDRVRSLSSPAYIVCANPEKVYQIRGVAWLRQFFEAADMVIPDGIGIVVAARLLHGRKLKRVAGADLMQAICVIAPARNYRIFIYGSSEITNRQAVEILRLRHPGIDIVGVQHGYLPPEKMDDLILRINEAAPDILFVGSWQPAPGNVDPAVSSRTESQSDSGNWGHLGRSCRKSKPGARMDASGRDGVVLSTALSTVPHLASTAFSALCVGSYRYHDAISNTLVMPTPLKRTRAAACDCPVSRRTLSESSSSYRSSGLLHVVHDFPHDSGITTLIAMCCPALESGLIFAFARSHSNL